MMALRHVTEHRDRFPLAVSAVQSASRPADQQTNISQLLPGATHRHLKILTRLSPNSFFHYCCDTQVLLL